MRSPRTATKSSPRSSQPEEHARSNEDPEQQIINFKIKKSQPGSPIFPSGCEGKLGVALESLQGRRDLTYACVRDLIFLIIK